MKKIMWSKYKVIRSIWPYPDGWGVYRHHIFDERNREITDAGLTKEAAQQAADELNRANESKSITSLPDSLLAVSQ